MKRIRNLLMAIALVSGAGALTAARADGCYLCNSGSSCDQCRYGSNDTQDARKACEARGCKVGGTTTCSSAVNVKVCKVEVRKPVIASR
jgi:hypothetical protein